MMEAGLPPGLSTSASATGNQLTHRINDDVGFGQGSQAQPLDGGFFANREHIHKLELLVFEVIDPEFAAHPFYVYVRLAPSQERPLRLDLELLVIGLPDSQR